MFSEDGMKAHSNIQKINNFRKNGVACFGIDIKEKNRSELLFFEYFDLFLIIF